MAFLNSIDYYPSVVKDIYKHTSSLNKYFLCHYCDKKLISKHLIENHVKSCLISRTCSWCNITFKNRGNLVRHVICVHGDKSFVKPRPLQKCAACLQSFSDPIRLVYHIRSNHFNLKPKIMPYDDMNINQVWYEKLYNSSKIVEIKKAGPTMYLIRKVPDDAEVKVQEYNDVMDLSDMYPTKKLGKLGQCHVCNQILLKRDIKKHFDERHMQIQKHFCNNCKKSFKRSVAFVRHVCNKVRHRRKR